MFLATTRWTNCEAAIVNRTSVHKRAGSTHDKESYKEFLSSWQLDLRFWYPLIQWQFDNSVTPYKSCLFPLMCVEKCQRQWAY